MLLLSLWCVCVWSLESTVLDPSLYLAARPPLTDGADSIPPATLWSHAAKVKSIADSNGLSGHEGRPDNVGSEAINDNTKSFIMVKYYHGSQTSQRKPNAMEKPKLFWPSLRPSHYSVGTGNIRVPLTFSLSGIYGKYAPGAVGTSIIGSTYGTVAEIGGMPMSSLAGSASLRYPGLQVYGRENGPTWSGWGNGKWGHYGKG